MHQGNLFVDARAASSPSILASWGGSGARSAVSWRKSSFGFIRRDYLRVAEVHFEAGYVPHAYRVEDFAQALRAIGEPIHSRTADQISMAKLLTLLFEITALFDMTTRIELVMLQKTMVVVEGRGAKARPSTQHVVDRRAGGRRLDRGESRPGRAHRRRRSDPFFHGQFLGRRAAAPRANRHDLRPGSRPTANTRLRKSSPNSPCGSGLSLL